MSEQVASDGEALRTALLQYLCGEAASTLEDRELLLRAIENTPSWVDPNGRQHLGDWQLDAADATAPTLRCRLPGTKHSMRWYVATLGRWRDAWRVTELRYEHLLGR